MSGSNQSVVLLPCPFCGSEDVSVSYDDYDFARWVCCVDCECDGALLLSQPGTKEASLAGVVRKWNTRWILGKRFLFKYGLFGKSGGVWFADEIDSDCQYGPHVTLDELMADIWGRT
jgi:Lar family restriction alleviation protein